MRFAQIVCASLVAAFIASPSVASGQDVQAFQQQIDQLKKQLDAIQAQLTALQAAQPPAAPAAAPTPAPPPGAAQTAEVPPGAAGAGGPGGALPVYGTSGAAAASSKVFNPDMAVIGDFLGAAGTNPVQPDPFSLGSDHPNALQ